MALIRVTEVFLGVMLGLGLAIAFGVVFLILFEKFGEKQRAALFTLLSFILGVVGAASLTIRLIIKTELTREIINSELLRWVGGATFAAALLLGYWYFFSVSSGRAKPPRDTHTWDIK